MGGIHDLDLTGCLTFLSTMEMAEISWRGRGECDMGFLLGIHSS